MEEIRRRLSVSFFLMITNKTFKAVCLLFFADYKQDFDLQMWFMMSHEYFSLYLLGSIGPFQSFGALRHAS